MSSRIADWCRPGGETGGLPQLEIRLYQERVVTYLLHMGAEGLSIILFRDSVCLRRKRKGGEDSWKRVSSRGGQNRTW